jgi:hypothetical protein
VAGVLASKDRFDLALTLVEEILDESEQQPALARIAAGCADAAQPTCVEIIVQRSPGNGKAAHQLTVALARSGRYDEALKEAAELHDDETWIARVPQFAPELAVDFIEPAAAPEPSALGLTAVGGRHCISRLPI